MARDSLVNYINDPLRCDPGTEDGEDYRPALGWAGPPMTSRCGSSPIRPFIHQADLSGYEEAPNELASGRIPISRSAKLWQDFIQAWTEQYIPRSAPAGNRLYAAEFRGANGGQYVNVGRTDDIPCRTGDHCREANRHGWGLTNGWITPLLDPGEVKAAELATLDELRKQLPGVYSIRERFYQVPFQDVVRIIWRKFAIQFNWWEWEQVQQEADSPSRNLRSTSADGDGFRDGRPWSEP